MNKPIEKTMIVIEPPQGWLSLRLNDLWFYRELLFFFVWRDLKVRYKQTILGVTWAVLQPFLTMVIFSVIFGGLAKFPSDGIPYPVFSFTALLPWGLFSRALSDASMSLVNNQQMVSKIYFPRIFLPTAVILSGLVDFGISFVMLIGLMFFYGITPTWTIIALPLFLLLAIMTAMAVGIWLAALNVRYRDVKYMTPFLVQVWLYTTPVAYSSSLFPEKWRLLLGLNPMAGVIDGFRWALLGQQTQISHLVYVSTIMVLLLFVSGLVYFQRTEQTFADVI